MIKLFKVRTAILCIVVTMCIFLMTSCTNQVKQKPSNQTKLSLAKSNEAQALIKRNHFMVSDSIEAWNKRYLENRDKVVNNKLPDQEMVYGDVSSFNNCIVSSIITNDSCIGLRVLYGMDAFFKVHVMLVGINPDYTTMYIKRPKACEGDISGQAKDSINVKADEEMGGAEFGMEP